MKIILDSLEPIEVIWDDPGSYPNSIASYPMPSHQYVTGVSGELVFELSGDELAEMLEAIRYESAGFWIREVSSYCGDFQDNSIIWQFM